MECWNCGREGHKSEWCDAPDIANANHTPDGIEFREPQPLACIACGKDHPVITIQCAFCNKELKVEDVLNAVIDSDPCDCGDVCEYKPPKCAAMPGWHWVALDYEEKSFVCSELCFRHWVEDSVGHKENDHEIEAWNRQAEESRTKCVTPCGGIPCGSCLPCRIRIEEERP